jgi:uncharacterized protein YqgC (DUF456 family)
MSYIWATALVLINGCWLATNLFGLPGNWLMILGTALLAWYYSGSAGPGGDSMFSPFVLVAAVVLALAGEILEFIAGMVGARKAGASKRGAAGALVGGLVGALAGTFAIPVPIVGSLIGAALGAAGGAVLLEVSGGKELGGSLKAGLGAGTGRLLGTVVKLVVGAMIWAIVAVAAFWP